jgi:hypothetical protein
MKKNQRFALVFACFALWATVLSAQTTSKRYIASPKQLTERSGYRPAFRQEIPELKEITKVSASLPPLFPIAGKVSTISNAVLLGSAGNVFSCVRGEQNQVVAVDSLNLLAFIHRSNPSIFGGSSGHLRYDVSIDGGLTWSSDIGPLNTLNSNAARYPNISASNFLGGSNPVNAEFVYYAATVNAGANAFNGHVYGVSSVNTTGAPTATEHYAFQNQNAMLPGGLCQSARGIYWVSDIGGNGTLSNGDIYIYRGEYQPALHDIVFVRTDTIDDNSSLTYNGDPHLTGSNIAFSPDGETGWAAWLGDPIGGRDSIYSPVFSKSTDCGQTWSAAMEVNINAIAWIRDSLQSLWTDSIGNPASDGNASCGFDFDLTVDNLGNPHMAVVICTGRDYSVSSAFAKFLADVTTPNGGATWEADYISPILTFRTQEFGTATTVTMDNQVQIARDEGGCNLFFSWADSDTALLTGNGNGIGFGESANLAPNLRISAKNVASGMKTYPQLISDGDLFWEGAILFPALAPIVLNDPTGWNLPIVVAVMDAGDPINPATFHYLGNDCHINNSAWCNPASMDLGWSSFGFSSFVSPCSNPAVAYCNSAPQGPCVPVGVLDPQVSGVLLDDAFPNPSSGNTVIGITLSATTEAVLTLHNSIGQEIFKVADGEFAAGAHRFELDVSAFADGIYFYQLRTPIRSITKKLVVSH